MTDYDDPELETQWLAARRIEVAEYLQREGVAHGQIANSPAWHIVPYVSLWAVETSGQPGSIGWWAISGDLPNDYVSAANAKSPREAMTAIASLWQEAADCMARGERHPTFAIGSGDDDDELAPLLASRAQILLEWASDSEFWDDN